jgi:hypothetical protein
MSKLLEEIQKQPTCALKSRNRHPTYSQSPNHHHIRRHRRHRSRRSHSSTREASLKHFLDV